MNWSQTNDIVSSIKGTVNGHTADIILDTGAQITVVPGKFIYEDNLTGESVDILGINGSPRPYQTAKIPISINNKEVEEIVAVAPEDQLNSKVLLATPMCNKATQQLINGYIDKNKKDQVNTKSKNATPKQVQAVTRSDIQTTTPVSYSKQLETEYNEDDRASDLTYSPDSEYTETDDTSDDDTSSQAYAPLNKYLPSSPLPSSPQNQKSQTQITPEPYSSSRTPEPYGSTLTKEPYSSTLTPEPHSSTQNKELHSSSLTPEPYSSSLTPEPYSSTLNPEPYNSHLNINKSLTEPYSPDLEPKMQQVENKPQTCIEDIIETLPELPITSKGTTTHTLKLQIKDDQTLKTIRGLAHHSKNGYAWENGLIFHITTDHTLGERKRLVVPKAHRLALIELAHNKSGHFSVNKTKLL